MNSRETLLARAEGLALWVKSAAGSLLLLFSLR
jgi:hypothetical protein